eukprot:PLAT7948.2.p1 GENE.PLAT7948.2~~PLAT7948.2.p1  ORF type:complete len:315 (+),score=101.41 PLAT7948.2:72-947(+)
MAAAEHPGATEPVPMTDMPLPFSRVMQYVSGDMQHGDDILIAQTLVGRTPTVPALKLDGYYGSQTEVAVKSFQKYLNKEETGIIDAPLAQILLKNYSCDGVKDNQTMPSWALYKVVVPVRRDRMVEMDATLYAANGTALHTFKTHTRAQSIPGTNLPRNQFTSDGMTPTGYSTFDLNSPESDVTDFGPYPINRVVQGISGNTKLLLPGIRNGILMHTGEWPNWNPSMEMPNSHGCIHAHPDDIRDVWKILVSLGVQVHKNVGGEVPYPYKPQGVIVVELVEECQSTVNLLE